MVACLDVFQICVFVLDLFELLLQFGDLCF